MASRTHRIFPAVAASLVLSFVSPAFVAPAFAETSVATLQSGFPSLAPIVDRIAPAVVNITVKTKSQVKSSGADMQNVPEEFRPFFEAPGSGGEHKPDVRQGTATGSGVIVDANNGYVMTNFHVINNASEITVTLKDRREFTAKLIGSDAGTDVALLQIDAKNLTAATLGDSSALHVGDYVIAVGNPFGLGQTVTSGIVSALGRSGLAIEGYEDFIQTDASINPGNSGGALVNMKGELVGINTAILGPNGANVGIGFAVPTAMAGAVMSQLVKYGQVERGRIGVQIQEMTPQLAKDLGVEQTTGAVISKVDKTSPAERSGIKTGDVVVAVDGKPLSSSFDLRNRIGLMRVGTSSHLTIVRNGNKKDIEVTIDASPKAVTVASVEERPTLQGATFASTDGRSSNTGVEVTDVAHNSPAWEIGLRPKDVVVAVNRKPVGSVEEFDNALKSQRQAALFIKRGGEDVLIVA
jgi:Do/DeqQ family serine protease